MWFLLYYLLYLLSWDWFAALTRLWSYKFFIWIYEFLKNHPQKRVFHNESLSNIENVLQRNLRTDRGREWIFRVSGGTNFEHFSARCQPWLHLHGFNVCTILPKKTLEMSLPTLQTTQNFLKKKKDKNWMRSVKKIKNEQWQRLAGNICKSNKFTFFLKCRYHLWGKRSLICY